MDFLQALLWTVFTAIVGCFVYIFYALIKEHKDYKDKPDAKSKKRKPREPAVVSTGKTANAKTNHEGTSIATQISDIGQSNVNVINITNYGANSDLTFMKEKDSGTAGEKTSFTGSLSAKQKNKDKKGHARVYSLPLRTEPKQKMSTRTRQ